MSENGKDKETNPLLNPQEQLLLKRLIDYLFGCCGLQFDNKENPLRKSSPIKPEVTKSEPEVAKPEGKPAGETGGEESAENVTRAGGKNLGKLGILKPMDDEIAEIFEPVREHILEILTEMMGKSPQKLEVTGYRAQTIVGINYFTKVKIDEGPKVIHAKIYSPVEGEPFLKGISTMKNETDELEYF